MTPSPRRDYLRPLEIGDNNMNTLHPKVAAAAIGGSAATIIVWIAGLVGLDVPPEVSAAFAVLIGALAGYSRAA